MAITDAKLDRARWDENEMVVSLKELEHLCHLEKLYHESMQAMMFMKIEFQDVYTKFTIEWHLFIAGIANFQEDILMALATYKDVERWYEK
jgi:hypothetical protein